MIHATSLFAFILAAVDAFRISSTLFFFHHRQRMTTTRLIRVANEALYDISKIPDRKGKVEVTRGENQYKLAYRIFRPMSLSSRQAAPVVVLHGGPSLPSNYLLPLANVIPYRSIVFYDQLGCGDSDEPMDLSSNYSIAQSVDDLCAMLKKLSISRRFHLYGHSYGGILAYEYVKRCADQGDDDDNSSRINNCLSVVLSSAPSSIAKSNAEYDRLLSDIGNAELFQKTHVCRTYKTPPPLARAYEKAGTVYAGTNVIADYVAEPTTKNADKLPPCMLILGEYDFVVDPDWKNIWNKRFRTKVMAGCSHFVLLEDPVKYGETLESFFAEYDE